MATILIINGPNLNLLGSREPQHYGAASLSEIMQDVGEQARGMGHELQHIQANAEHELIKGIHNARPVVDFMIINPAAFTHTSIAIRDALVAVGIPFIEVHLSNIYARETFRRQSFFSDIAAGVISGLGAQGYGLALQAADQYLRDL